MDKNSVTQFCTDLYKNVQTRKGKALTLEEFETLTKTRLKKFQQEMGAGICAEITQEILSASGLEGNKTEIDTFLLGLTTRVRARVSKMYNNQLFE